MQKMVVKNYPRLCYSIWKHVQCTLRVQSEGMGTIAPITLIERTFFRINLISINVRINRASFWSVVFLTTILLRTLNSNKVTKMTQNKISYINVMYRWFMINSYILMPRLLTYKCVIFRLRSPGALPLSELGVFFVWLGFLGGSSFCPWVFTPLCDVSLYFLDPSTHKDKCSCQFPQT